MATDDPGRPETDAGESQDHSGHVAAECGHCRKRFKLRGWRAGVKCPSCSTGELSPLLAEGGAVDYCLADRSGGYARMDIRLAQWLKWAGIITPHQYDLAFQKQHRRIRQNKQPAPIHTILIQEGWITEKQAVSLLEFMTFRRPDRDDRLYADAVVSTGAAGEEDVRRCIRLQEKIAETASETPALCQVMLEKHVLNEARTVALLRSLRGRGQGPLCSLADEIGGPGRKQHGAGATLQFVRQHRRALRQFALIAFLFLAAAGVWIWHNYEPPYRFMAVCESCDGVNVIVWSQDVPQRCPDCGRQGAYPARICRDGHVFPARIRFVPLSCPVCGSREVRELGADDMKAP